jgi:hypothetical protein
MRVHTATEEAVLNQPNFKVYYEFRVEGPPGFTLGDLAGDPTYDPFVSGSITASIDQPVQSASFTFHLGKGSKSLSPFLSTGIKNAARTAPAIYPGRRVSFRTACIVPEGHSLGLSDPQAAFRSVFQGRIDSVEPDPDNDLLTIKCRDLFAELQDHWIDTLALTADGYQYGFPIDAAPVHVAMQQIITKVYGVGAGPQILLEENPELAIGPGWIDGRVGTLEVLRRLGLQNGWDLRGRWDWAYDSFDLTYADPDRAKTLTAVTSFAKTRYNSLKLSTGLANVRNRCDVIPANDTRIPQRVEDANSIAQFGVRFAGLSEDRSSHIDTDAEALALAGIMANDLSSPPVDVSLEMPYYWLLELNDLFQILPDGFAYDSDNVYAVSSITHTFAESGEPTTSISGGLTARAAVSEWTRGRQRLNQVRLGPPAGPGFEGDIWLQVDDLTPPTPL